MFVFRLGTAPFQALHLERVLKVTVAWIWVSRSNVYPITRFWGLKPTRFLGPKRWSSMWLGRRYQTQFYIGSLQEAAQAID